MAHDFCKVFERFQPVSAESFRELFRKYRLIVFKSFPEDQLTPFLSRLGAFRNQSLSSKNELKELNFQARLGDHSMVGAMPWHHDCPFLDPSPSAVSIYCRQPSKHGGQTDWVDMSAVLKSFSTREKKFLRSVDVIHKASCFEKYVHFPFDPKAFSSAEKQEQYVNSLVSQKPLVRFDSWRDLEYIYCSEGYTDSLMKKKSVMNFFKNRELGHEAKQELIETVNEESEKYFYRHDWAAGDLVFADNLSLSHRRLPWSAADNRAVIRAQIFFRRN